MPDFQIITVDPETGIVSISTPQAPKKLTGTDLLVQLVALKILKTFDQDVFDPKEGTDTRAVIGQYNFEAGGVEEVRIMVIEKIQKIQQDIITEQGPNIGTPSERLRELRLLDAAWDNTTGEVALRIQVVNESGNTRDIVV